MSGGIISPLEICKDIWRIDLERLEWIKLDCRFKEGKYYHLTSLVDDSYLYCLGGDHSKNIYRNELQKFTVEPKTLYRLCIESIQHLPILRIRAEYLPPFFQDELDINA
ncbi:hypothetical protein RF11_15627 [Thelohanellus kitauei]|uniref:Kelch domain-containing protein 10 n=1 Tax=Thelohanellus kitauei TaxID=669202 RepID=A0A0C2NC77_THEKT|nr:hypothetical protein RF11_15627 [Thelohanellus kitauei]